MVHPALEPYVRAIRANPAPHPSTVSIEERRATYRQLAEANRGEPEPVESVVDGEVALEDPISRYLPEGVKAPREPTTGHGLGSTR